MLEKNEIIQSVLRNLRIEELNPMQEASLEQATGKKDVILLSPTGSGKTLAYLLPLLLTLKTDDGSVQVLILVPSRELALQIDSVFKAMGTSWKTCCCYGGHPIAEEKKLGAMALFGYFTKRDLSGIGNMGYMALIGIIIATVVNLFLRSETMMWVITYIGVLVFVALTAYDTQKIKKMVMNAEVVDESTQKIALLGSLTLYLDFINLFLYLLRILGSRK